MKHNYDHRSFASRPELYRFLAQILQSQLHKREEMGGYFSIALSGGNTPREFLQFLSDALEKDMLAHAVFFQVDERFVAPDHHESNRRMIEAELIVPAQIKHWFPIRTDCDSPATSAAAYDRLLAASSFLNHDEAGTPVFDLVLLGIGDDGHTASLFPGTKTGQSFDRYAIHTSPELKTERITLTLPVLIAARKCVFIVTGENKQTILRELFESDRPMPARTVIEKSGHSLVLFDKMADFREQ